MLLARRSPFADPLLRKRTVVALGVLLFGAIGLLMPPAWRTWFADSSPSQTPSRWSPMSGEAREDPVRSGSVPVPRAPCVMDTRWLSVGIAAMRLREGEHRLDPDGDPERQRWSAATPPPDRPTPGGSGAAILASPGWRGRGAFAGRAGDARETSYPAGALNAARKPPPLNDPHAPRGPPARRFST